MRRCKLLKGAQTSCSATDYVTDGQAQFFARLAKGLVCERFIGGTSSRKREAG
jgi:hypothetical protein